MGCAVALLTLSFICVCLALAGNLAALTGYDWFSTEGSSSTTYGGLFRGCTQPKGGDLHCTIASRLFRFDSILRDYSIVLVLMIASCGFIFFSLITTLCMFCCMRSSGGWCCGAFSASINLFLGAGAGMAAMVYWEVEQGNIWDVATRGWSNIVGWIGSGFGIIALILAMAMCCVKPSGRRGGHVNVVVNPPYAGGPQKDYPMVNRGYQHGY